MPPPAGTGLDRRSFVARRARARALRLRRAACCSLVRGGHRAGRARPGAAGARLRLPARRRRRALGPRTRRSTRTTASCARRSRSPDAGPAFAEDARLRWHPSLAPLATLHGEGKVIGHAGGRLHAPRPVALHVAPLLGGRGDRRAAATGWLGRYLDHVGTDDNPLQGLSLDYQLQPSLATAKVPVASLDRARRVRLLDAPGSGATSRRGC